MRTVFWVTVNSATTLLFNLVLSWCSAQVSGMEETDSSMEGISRAFRGMSLQGLGPKKKPWVLPFHLSIVLQYFFKIPDGPINQPWMSLWPYDPCIFPYTFAFAHWTPMDGFWQRRRPYSRVRTSLTALLLWTPPLILSCRHYNREQREHRVFQSLLATVPGLADRITDEQATEQDIQHIADLVKLSWLGANFGLIYGHWIAPERCWQCQIQYQESEECHHWLAHTAWSTAHTTSCLQC